jgi:glutaredoxin
VYVANLREKKADGTYPVTSMPRSEWDELGAKNRKARLEALAPSAMPPAAPSSSAAAVAGDVSAIVYGASWCGPCHQAEALLKSLGVKVTKKDIEENPSAGAEMREKLQRVHRQGGSIPVIDVMGQILIGFSPGALRAAVDHARGGGTL